MKLDTDNVAGLLVLGAVAAGAVYLLTRNAGGLVTGNNAITQAATNAAGQPVTAYQGAGVVGTLGAATNAASGGWLATAGQRLGSWLYDITHPTEPAPATQKDNPATGQGTAATQVAGWDYTGRDQLSFAELAAQDGWWQSTMRPLDRIPQGVT